MLIKEREVKTGLGKVIIRQFNECMKGYNYIRIDCEDRNGKQFVKNEDIYLNKRNSKYLTLLMILCDDIEEIDFHGIIKVL